MSPSVAVGPAAQDVEVVALTFDLRGKVGGVTSDEELQLLIEVTLREVDVPRPDAWRRRQRVRYTHTDTSTRAD